ncbi:hypothetical protein [Cytobacillus praedii]|uniref:Uncharacterized protein n=1 Tax=Cytobacillus praedii TaxID=1742358 RepID=A0A4R1B0D3_9BACI|nr:hypothetical protein [Cytobacillus praedii]MED3552891.1 hypothetical protein [Cytobacillus praedii]TCJ04565.1 hypothetical protein E0Y62_08970 [Cytobacillus praedii]
MKGIYIINELWQAADLTREQSIEVQKHAMLTYLKENQISAIKLNPLQLKDYYTIPHALLYDLKQHAGIQLDCLVIFSEETIAKFLHSYPARWIRIKSYFNEVLFVERQSNRQPPSFFDYH